MLIQVRIFHSIAPVAELIKVALFLHLGTFFAALIYFRHDVKHLLKATTRWKTTDAETKKTFWFLLIVTLVSSILGGAIFAALNAIDVGVENTPSLPGKLLTLIIGVALLVTAYLQLKAKKGEGGHKSVSELSVFEIIIVGLVQGLAILPGISRSGITVATLLMQKVDDRAALRLSFLMSLPIVLAGNILLNFNNFTFDIRFIGAMVLSFFFGLLTIHWFLAFAKKVNFGYFVLFFALMTLTSVFI